MIYSLLIVLLPLIIGYLIHINQPYFLKKINRLLDWMVYIILFFMGVSLAFTDNLNSNLQLIFKYSCVFFIFTIGCNVICLFIYNWFNPWLIGGQQQKIIPSRLSMLKMSLKMLGLVILGFLLGLTHWQVLTFADQLSELALFLLLLLVGIQLRNSNMTLSHIILNRRGFIIALIVAISSLAGGAIAALLLQLPINHGMAIASSNGWYSLSGIMLTQALGPVLGASAFFNDLFRELFCFLIIPMLAYSNPNTALGLCATTSMDTTLPILQRCAGIEIVPPAIVQGFILSLVAPIMMAFFTAG